MSPLGRAFSTPPGDTRRAIRGGRRHGGGGTTSSSMSLLLSSCWCSERVRSVSCIFNDKLFWGECYIISEAVGKISNGNNAGVVENKIIERERLRVLWEKRNNNRRREKVVRAWGTLPCQAPNGTTTNTFLSSSLLFPYQTCVLVLSSPNTMPVLLNVTILFSKLHSSFTPLLIYLVLHFNFFYPKYQHI